MGGVGVTRVGDFYAPIYNAVNHYSRRGFLVGSWPVPEVLKHVAVAPNGNIYGLGRSTPNVYYFDDRGNVLGSWTVPGGSYGVALTGLDIDADGTVFVSNYYNSAPPTFVKYYTPTGSLLGSLAYTSGYATEVALVPDGERLYVVNIVTVLYYRQDHTALTPASLGKIKALFK